MQIKIVCSACQYTEEVPLVPSELSPHTYCITDSIYNYAKFFSIQQTEQHYTTVICQCGNTEKIYI